MLSHLSRFRTLRTLAGATALALVGAAGTVAAGDPLPPAAPVAKPVAISDVALARAVLAAIDADPTLKDLNLVVSVVDRGAVIGGPVATEELRKHAERVVRSVSGIESVKNVCFVEAGPDPLMRAAVGRMKVETKPNGVAALPGVAVPPIAPEGYLPPVPAQAPSDLIVAAPAPKSVEVLRPALPSGPAASILGGPVTPGAAPKTNPLPTTAPAAPGALTGAPARPADVRAAVAAIRRADPRFARLTVETKPDGGLFVSGSSAKAADAWDFAAELRKVPGVARVAVDPQLVK